MSETPKSSPQAPRDDLAAARSQRQRRADNDGRHDRVAELSADITGLVQRATWSLTVAQAVVIADAIDPLEGDGIRVSGDHRPRARYSPPRPYLHLLTKR